MGDLAKAEQLCINTLPGVWAGRSARRAGHRQARGTQTAEKQWVRRYRTIRSRDSLTYKHTGNNSFFSQWEALAGFAVAFITLLAAAQILP